MKKQLFILIVFSSILASLYADSFRFSIVWDKVIESQTAITVVDYSDDTTISTKALNQVSTKQNVARIKYTSNEGGIHTLSYKATPLMSNDDDTAYAFNLFFNYTESGIEDTAVIEVGNDSSKTYPNGVIEAKTEMNMGQGGQDGIDNPRYIYIQVQVTSLESMQTNVQYTSTITIERQTT